jgi:hypothetical protein
MMKLNSLQRVLVALSTVGPENAYEVPGLIVERDAPAWPALYNGPHGEMAAIELDVSVLEEAVRQGFAVNPGANARRFMLTDRGQQQVWGALGVGSLRES